MAKTGSQWRPTVNPNASDPNARGKVVVLCHGTRRPGQDDEVGHRSFKVTRCNFPAVFAFQLDSSGAACPASTISLYFTGERSRRPHRLRRDGLLHVTSGATGRSGRSRSRSPRRQDTKGTWTSLFQIPVTNDWGSSGIDDRVHEDRPTSTAGPASCPCRTASQALRAADAMSKLAPVLPRLALFGVMVVVGFVISSAVVPGAPGPVAAVRRDRGPRLRPRRRAGHPGRVARARRVQRRAIGLARDPPIPGAGRPHRRRRQPARRRAGGLQEPVGLPAHPADLPVRRRPVPGLELHADLGRDDRAAGVRDRDLRLDAAHAAGRPGRRHRPQRPQPGPVARLWRDAADRVPPAGPAQGPARRRATARSSRASTGRSRAGSACRRTSSAATRSTSTATTRATPTRGSPRPTT